MKVSIDTLDIPSSAGIQRVSGRFQNRTQLQYILLALVGLGSFYGSQNQHVRVVELSCLFPGAGFLAVGGIGGGVGLVLSLALLPFSLFAWFGAGGIAFVVANWIIQGVISASIAKSVCEPSALIVLIAVIGLSSYCIFLSQRRKATALKLRESRNKFLPSEDAAWRARISQKKPLGKRELSEQEVRLLQHVVQMALQRIDDWSNFVRIDQFQTSALRYQLYQMQYVTALIHKHYMPNFHGYIKRAQENVIEKSLTQDVMNYWKWESLWGKFTLDWDPLVKDNIMVTGFIMICLATYEKLTGDARYSKRGSLEFQITRNARYKHDTGSIYNALMRNWREAPYCLYPCEPNWIYSACNLTGMQGALAYDTVKKTGRTQPMLEGRYYRGFEEDFVNPDGSLVAICSSLTGFQLMGAVGVLGDIGGAVMSAASMPNLARRLWLMSRKTNIEKIDGKWKLVNLVGADKIDVGNYTPGEGFAHALTAFCAAQFGEDDIKTDFLQHLDNNVHPIVHSPTGNGALFHKGLSVMGNCYALMARVASKDDWSDLINSPVDEASLAAPKLDKVPFPEVLVARCHAFERSGLDFVLRGPSSPKTFTIELKHLEPGRKYVLDSISDQQAKTTVIADLQSDSDGIAHARILVASRSEFELRVV